MKKGVLYLFSLWLLSPFSIFAQTIDQTTSPLYRETIGVVDKVSSTNNYAGNFNPDSAASLPFGIIKEIGIAKYIIAIDSAGFGPGKSSFNAYMAIEFPGSQDRLAFAAKNIAFNPKGVVPGNNTRLVLVSEHRISIGPHLHLVLKPDGNNYVDWDCNGFKGVGLSGYFELGNNILVPDTTATTDKTVKATFSVYASDIHDLVAQVSITPFCIKDLKDISFNVTDAAVDMSDLKNYPGMIFPQGYFNNQFGGQTSLWTGFYLKQLKIKLPKEISKSGNRTELIVSDFLVDNNGVSGNFSATNLFSTSEGKMGNWGFSVDQIGLTFIANSLTGGSLGGKVLLPLNSGSGLAYNANVYQNLLTHTTDYMFSLSPVSNYSAQVLSAEIELYPTSKITVVKTNQTLKPSAELNGKITFNHSLAKTTALEMQKVCIIDQPPYITNGIFSFTGTGLDSSSRLSGFNISISEISLSSSSVAPSIGFGAGINFTSRNDNAFGAAARFSIVTKVEPPGNKWSFDKIDINDIGVSIHTNAFKFDGLLKFKNNDPQYGNGFFGSLSLSIDKILPNPASANVWFGNVSNFNYYYFDLAIPSTLVILPPTSIPQGLALYRFMGGLYYHMRPATTNQAAALYSAAFGKAQSYIPDVSKGVGIKAGVTFGAYPNNGIFNGDVALDVQFTSSGGLGSISFSGNGFMMVKLDERVPTPKSTLPVKAGFAALYDHENNVFHALLSAQVNAPSVTAQGLAELHFDKDIWYIHFGKPNNRVMVNLANLASANTYIMLGNKLEPIPDPPAEVTSIFGHGMANSRDVNSTANGSGLVMGASLGAGSSGSFGLSDFSVYYNLGLIAGFDVMAINYGSNAHCSGSSGRAGFNGWYAQGDVYAALWGTIGARGHAFGSDFDIQLVSVSAAAMLAGKFPNPSSVSGELAVNYDFLRIFKGSFDCNFSAGSSCTITN